MPIRSSVCTYSPLSANSASTSAGSTRRYSPSTSGSRFSTTSASSKQSTISPAVYGQYKTLASSPTTTTTSLTPSTGYSRYSSSPSSSSITSSPSHSRYLSSSSSAYSPSAASSASSISSSATGLYRPLSSSDTSSSSLSPSSSHRSSFNSRGPTSATTSLAASNRNRFSVSNISLNSSISSNTSDYILTGTPTAIRVLNGSSSSSSGNHHKYGGQQSSSAYSSASLTSSASSNSGLIKATTNYSTLGSMRTRRPTYTSHSSLSSLESFHQQQNSTTATTEPLPRGVPYGLVNLGNTCYMNASLQALYSIEQFRNLLVNALSMVDSSKSLTSGLMDLFRKMKDSSNHRPHTAVASSSPSSTSSVSSSYSTSSSSSMSPINPSSFKHTFARYQSKFSGYEQQDAQEFLRYLINGVHEESNQANRRNRRRTSNTTAQSSSYKQAPATSQEAWTQYKNIIDDSPFVDVLVGQLCSTITCSECQHKSHCWDPFWDLSLPLMSGRGYSRYECNLQDLLNEFTAKETLDSDERPTCERCKKPTRSTKQISLARLPPVLILHLKKFSNDGYKLSSPDVKIETVLKFPDSNTVYNLKACISHHGHSSSSGHYTSHCEYSSSWYHFDDDRVRDTSSSFGGARLDDAYVLFYTSQKSKL